MPAGDNATANDPTIDEELLIQAFDDSVQDLKSKYMTFVQAYEAMLVRDRNAKPRTMLDGHRATIEGLEQLQQPLKDVIDTRKTYETASKDYTDHHYRNYRKLPDARQSEEDFSAVTTKYNLTIKSYDIHSVDWATQCYNAATTVAKLYIRAQIASNGEESKANTAELTERISMLNRWYKTSQGGQRVPLEHYPGQEAQRDFFLSSRAYFIKSKKDVEDFEEKKRRSSKEVA